MTYYPYVFHPIVLVGGGLLLVTHEWRPLPNRVFVEAHTWSQSMAGAVLAAVVAGFHAVRRSRTRRPDRTTG